MLKVMAKEPKTEVFATDSDDGGSVAHAVLWLLVKEVEQALSAYSYGTALPLSPLLFALHYLSSPIFSTLMNAS
jgi:hypothetical protein